MAKPTETESFVLLDLPEYRWLKPAVDLIPNQTASPSAGVLIDLRKLRFRNLALPNEWTNLIYGYDLLVILPEFTPSSLYR